MSLLSPLDFSVCTSAFLTLHMHVIGLCLSLFKYFTSKSNHQLIFHCLKRAYELKTVSFFHQTAVVLITSLLGHHVYIRSFRY